MFAGHQGGLGVNMCVAEAAMIDTKAVRVSVLEDADRVESLAVLSGFRADLYDCLNLDPPTWSGSDLLTGF
ncbi:hypothetical protein [Streptomyces atratus]|uniref:hypothetical protein n=1 Tax=Streptomyces atratus TaxID=1893 RepID=UPI0032454A1F